MSDRLKRTPFYVQHLEAGAKMVPFAGFEMPIQYEGIKVEHRAVRENILRMLSSSIHLFNIY